jgi:alpha-ribazole phosphatase
MERKTMHNVYLLRHGRTEGPAALNGSTDVAVATHVQYDIAAALKQHECSFSRIITSPLKRCSDLAAILAAENPSLDVVTEANFRELHFGRFDGIPFDQIEAEQEQLMAFWRAPATATLPEAEPLDDAYARVASAWEACVKTLQQDTLIITHGGPIRLILAHTLEADWTNPNWHSALSIGYQTLTHLQIFTEGTPFVWIKNIGSEI